MAQTSPLPPTSMFFSGSYSLSLPPSCCLSFSSLCLTTPNKHTLHNPPKSLVFRLAFSWSQKPTNMGNKSEMGIA